MRKKQQTTEQEDSHDHIILHHAPAALLQAEKHLIHLDAELSLLGLFLGSFVKCFGSLCTFYLIYKIVSVQYIVMITYNIYIVIRETGQFSSKGIINDFLGNLNRLTVSRRFTEQAV